MREEERYAIDLCDVVLGQRASRQHRFDFLRGDALPNRKGTKLPVDAYYAEFKIVIEYCERQHYEAIPFFDKPEALTVSNVSRGEQRRLYDERRRQVLPMNGIEIIEIDYRKLKRDSRGKLTGDVEHDKAMICHLLRNYLDEGSPRQS